MLCKSGSYNEIMQQIGWNCNDVRECECVRESEPLWPHLRHEPHRQKTIYRSIQGIVWPLLETLGLTPSLAAPGATVVALFGVSRGGMSPDLGSECLTCTQKRLRECRTCL